METIEQRASGTTFQEISKKNFRPISVIIPDDVILQQFNSLVEPLIATITNNAHESRTLAETRDALLPKLVSGALRVGEVG